MHIPLVTRAVATALSTPAATLPVLPPQYSVSVLGPSTDQIDHAVQATHSAVQGPELRKEANVPLPNDSVLSGLGLGVLGPGPKMPLDPHLDPSPPNSVPTLLPSLFWPEEEDQKFYHIGEDNLTGCIRDAVKEAGKERWIEIVRSDGPDEFLTKIRDDGLVGEDTNQDSNEVEGLVDWVRTLAEDDNPDLDTATDDTDKCASLVRRFAAPKLVDELIVDWAEREGHIRKLPPTKPEPEETHVRGNLTHHGSPPIPLNLTTSGNQPTPLNLTTSGNLTVHSRHGSFKTGRYSNSSAPGHSSSPENSGETGDEKDFILGLKLISQVEPEIFELFGRNSTLVISFFDQPEINELLLEAIEEQQAADSDSSADPAYLLKFLKDFVQNSTDNSFTGP